MKAEKRGLRKQMISNLESVVEFLMGGVLIAFALMVIHILFLAIVFVIAGLTLISSGYFTRKG
jgi:ABC-type protease/lipase transport system fused ATPase/permease subunit